MGVRRGELPGLRSGQEEAPGRGRCAAASAALQAAAAVAPDTERGRAGAFTRTEHGCRKAFLGKATKRAAAAALSGFGRSLSGHSPPADDEPEEQSREAEQ